jgi:hypothetical protein
MTEMTPDEGITALAERYDKDSDQLLEVLHQTVLDRHLEPHEAAVFIGLLVSATAAQKHLKRGYRDRDIAYISWASRTLLELLVWTHYCARSKENTLRFYQDSVRDLGGAMVAYRELASDPERFSDDQRAVIRETENKTMALAAKLGVSPGDKGFLPVHVAAEEVGLGIDYQKANRIFSKLVHPTAYMVCASITDRLSGSASENFFMAGVDYALRLFAVLSAFADRARSSLDVAPPALLTIN